MAERLKIRGQGWKVRGQGQNKANAPGRWWKTRRVRAKLVVTADSRAG